MTRPRVYKTEAIVLRQRKLGEADKIVTLFTPNYGKLDSVAKGARRTMAHELVDEECTFGAASIQDFTFKDLLDLDACTRCGRCQDNCPAYLSGKPLSPKKIVQDLKRAMTSSGPALLKAKTGGNPVADA